MAVYVLHCLVRGTVRSGGGLWPRVFAIEAPNEATAVRIVKEQHGCDPEVLGLATTVLTNAIPFKPQVAVPIAES